MAYVHIVLYSVYNCISKSDPRSNNFSETIGTCAPVVYDCISQKARCIYISSELLPEAGKC